MDHTTRTEIDLVYEYYIFQVFHNLDNFTRFINFLTHKQGYFDILV